jgi:hypothetical protein
MILRHATTLNPIALDNAVPALSDPLSLGRFLANWRNAGFELPPHEIDVLLTDADVDAFFETFVGKDVGVIFNPVLSDDGNAELVRGSPVYPIASLERPDHDQ